MTAMEAINQACRTSFDAFAMKAFNLIEPGTPYEWGWAIGCIAEHLQASFDGQLPWLIINVPPRCLKSVLVAQLYPAWVMGKEPHHQFIGASYAHSLSERNVVKARQVMQHEWYQQCFPATRISADQNQKDFFTTTQAGQYKGTGIGGTITGFGCSTLLADDLINPKEAGSATVRATTNDEMRSTLFSRFNNRETAKFIMIMQRLHEADPTGELLASSNGRFHLLKLPAETKTTILISLKDKSWVMPADSTISERLNHKHLAEIREDMSDYQYVSQYLQEPVPLGGGEFRQEWLQYYLKAEPESMNIYIMVDAAGGDEVNKKKKKTSDWTVMSVIGVAQDGNYYLLDMVRDRLNPTERIDTLFFLHRKWKAIVGPKKAIRVGYEKYGMMTDTHYAKEKMGQDNYHFPIDELAGQMSKEERIRRIIPDMQHGRWFIPESMIYNDQEGRAFDLIKEMKGEMASFPKARHDDILDSVSRIMDMNVTFPMINSKTMYNDANDEPTSWADW